MDEEIFEIWLCETLHSIPPLWNASDWYHWCHSFRHRRNFWTLTLRNASYCLNFIFHFFFTMVEENFEIWLCETPQVALILSFTSSPWLKKILSFVSVKRLILPSFYHSHLQHGWRNFWNLTLWNASYCLNSIVHSFTMVEENFEIWLCETPHIALMLSFTLSPWLKKILKFAFVKRLILP